MMKTISKGNSISPNCFSFPLGVLFSVPPVNFTNEAVRLICDSVEKIIYDLRGDRQQLKLTSHFSVSKTNALL